MKYIIFVFGFFVMYGCSFNKKKEHPIHKSLSEASVVTYNAQYERVTLKEGDNYEEIKIEDLSILPTYKKSQLDLFDLSASFTVAKGNTNNFIISQSNFKVFKYDQNFSEKVNEFGRNGRGPGEGGFINAASVSDNDIILYDSNLTKLVCYSPEGHFKFERIIDKKVVPYHISSIVNVQDNIYVATGMSRDEWLNLNKKMAYSNVYLLEIDSNKIDLVGKDSLLPENIKDAVLTGDIISSTVTSPFKIVKGQNEDDYFLFNLSSETVYKLEVQPNSIKVKKEIHLSEKFFQHHPVTYEDDLLQNPQKAKAWQQNGSYFINIFQNSDYIFYYMSELTDNATIYNLIITDYDENVIRKLVMPISNVLRYIDNERLYFFSYDRHSDVYLYEFISIEDVL